MYGVGLGSAWSLSSWEWAPAGYWRRPRLLKAGGVVLVESEMPPLKKMSEPVGTMHTLVRHRGGHARRLQQK